MADEGASALRVRFWGTRGSIPVPGEQTVRFGGNTSCVEIRAGEEILILDAGTGIRSLGQALMGESSSRSIRAHLVVGHTHWDHIQGFPFFEPAYMRGNEFLIYSAGKSLKAALDCQFQPAYFPVLLSELKATLRFLELPDPLRIGPVTLSHTQLNHPDGSVGFRVSAFGKSVVYMSDHEAFAPESPVQAAESRRIEEFARGADLLIGDAQYTDEEYKSRRGWGHSTFANALDLALRAGVGQLAFFHHEPARSDEQLDRIIDEAQSRAGTVVCFGAREGLEVII